MTEPKKDQKTQIFAEMWSPTTYGNPALASYAKENMEQEIRSGIRALCLVFLILISGSAVLNLSLRLNWLYLYTYSIIAALSLHMFWAAKRTKGINALYLLGTTLLVVSSTSLVLLANKTGSFSLPLFVSIVLVFMIVPLVPWGLKESFQVVLLIYLVFTLSSLTSRAHFPRETLYFLQFLMTASGVTILSIIGRNTAVRRKEIKNLYELEIAKDKLHTLSCKDPLTGAWNRRYLKKRFEDELQSHQEKKQVFYFALLDVDNFKFINDTYGHDFGDQILQWVATCFSQHFTSPHDVLIRMGGDEFAILLSSNEPEEILNRGIEFLQDCVRKDASNACDTIHVSIGMTAVPPDNDKIFADIYQDADKALYKAKEADGSFICRSEAPVYDLTS